MTFKVSKAAEAKVKTVSSLSQLCMNYSVPQRAVVPKPLLDDEFQNESRSYYNLAKIGYGMIDEGMSVTAVVNALDNHNSGKRLNTKERLYWNDVLARYRFNKKLCLSQKH